jgi:hypothetical protein
MTKSDETMSSRGECVPITPLQIFILSVLPAVAFLSYRFLHSSSFVLNPDSPSYMYFDPSRPVGYPIFLSAVRILFGGFAAAQVVQLAILCSTFALLSFSLLLVTRSLVASLIVEVLLFINPGPLELSDTLISDSLSCAFIAIFSALILLLAKFPQRSAVFALALTSALAVTIRPINMAFAPAALVAIFLFGQDVGVRRWIQLLIVVVAIAAGHLATPAVLYGIHGSWQTSTPFARSFFQKALFRNWATDSVPGQACDDENLIERITTPANLYIEAAPKEIRPFLRLRYSTYLRFKVIIPELAQLHGYKNERDVDRILMCYALKRVRQDPIYFIVDLVGEYLNLGNYWTFMLPGRRQVISKYIESHPPPLPAVVKSPAETYEMETRAENDVGELNTLAIDRDDVFALPPPRSPILIVGLRAFQLAICALTAGSIIAIFKWSFGKPIDKRWLIIAVLGILFQGEMLITAVAEIGVPRYMLPLWPISCVVAVLSFSIVCGHLDKAGGFLKTEHWSVRRLRPR